MSKKLLCILLVLFTVNHVYPNSDLQTKYNGYYDSVEVYQLELKNENYIKILDSIEYLTNKCMFIKNKPYYYLIQLNSDGFLDIMPILCDKMDFMTLCMISDRLIGFYIYNNSYHYVINKTQDTSFNNIFKKKDKILYTMGSYIDPICYKKDDNIWIKIAMINDDFKIVAVDSCIVCKDYEPLIQLGDIKYKNINPKSPSKHMVLNLPNIEDTLYGYIVMYVEFDNIHSMKIIKINKIDYIYLSKLEDSSYHKTIFFNPIIFQPTNEETKFLEQFMDEMNKKIKEIQFYIPRRYRWYDYILPWKKEKYKRISKNEEILIYFININNKKVL